MYEVMKNLSFPLFRTLYIHEKIDQNGSEEAYYIEREKEDQAFFQQLNTKMNDDLDIYNCTCIISFSIICPA